MLTNVDDELFVEETDSGLMNSSGLSIDALSSNKRANSRSKKNKTRNFSF